ncbi:hypothetical protein ASPZODRAFT_153337 [Penicilliopsis zonata CBS 506.65]|uniref:Altered inheritance of mitochondria protein 9, mitochondrial n=1 Tax=Penicilliopsis zonata CBS 506.65 TaxID=1073090 RepID=A0A1L9SD62_9EURO|nr:hypothetical protein ASPZODRAFT_153337 [Penicilliopsis zonata CBS 506.65]OJJ45027.1 hypothetical protein ASPZODRAFT_153337 [Penicilliopsis zonata CBS 506.65]
MDSPQTDWNSNDEFFKFTRGRFLVEEAENLRKREIRFDLNRLARVAADSVGAAQCVSITKYPDGMFNKAFLITMDNGREVVAKVPNPNAGIPHFTTASEVATMDFARNILDTPAPHVYTWNSQAESHPVGAEFIIMQKVEGMPLSQVWDRISLPQKLQVLLAMTCLQKQWLSVSFSHYGSLYYAGDVQPSVDSHYVKHDTIVRDPKQGLLNIERGPLGTREIKAIQSLKPPKQIALFCGPKLYQPNTENKITALTWYQQIIDFLIPTAVAITKPYLWHNDLHDDNVFVDPQNPERITGIIDWQSCHISPLFNHNPDPAFLDFDGLEPERRLIWRHGRDRFAAVQEYTLQNILVGWRKLMHAKNANLYRVVEFRKTAAYGLIFLAHRMFEYGEAHFQSLLVDLEHTWKDSPAVASEVPFPIQFIEQERYAECKAVLAQVKSQMLAQLAATEEERLEYERYWPFDP